MVEFVQDLPAKKPGRAGVGVKSNDGTSKVCSMCEERKLLSEFYKWSKGADGLQASCKSCQDRRLKAHHEKNPEKRKEAVWRNNIKRNYGISAETYAEMLFLQGGVCAICGEECSSGRKLSVDHNHSTGKVRGLLCLRCNSIAGVVENKDLLSKVFAYLEKEGESDRT